MFPGKRPTTWLWALLTCREVFRVAIRPRAHLELLKQEERRGLKALQLRAPPEEVQGGGATMPVDEHLGLEFKATGFGCWAPPPASRASIQHPREVSAGNGRESPHLSEERSHADGSLVDVIVLITAIYISSPDYHKCLITAEEGFAGEGLANYSFPGSDVSRPADWKRRRVEEELRRGEGEKGPLSDLIKGRDLNRYLIKCLLLRCNTGRSPCRQNRD